LTDVEMVRAGIGASALRRWGGKVICRLNAPDIAGRAAKAGDTRTETAIKDGLAGDIGLVAIGNAPTALLTAIEIANQRLPAERPALIVGVPVGFVNASESKEILTGCGIPFITVEGRKGGSPVAAAIVNALLRLA
jgi:precorrin-8X/cobalt-precorrin-8 methylmutase